MVTYTDVLNDSSSVFGSGTWALENIKTIPSNYTGTNVGTEYIRVSVVPSGASVNSVSKSGIMLIDLFTAAGQGPKRAFYLADRLDAFLVGKSRSTAAGKRLQFFQSSLTPSAGVDPANPTLTRASYSIPFQYFGVN